MHLSHFLAACWLLLCSLYTLEAAPQPYNTRNCENENAAGLRNMRTTLEELRHSLNNQETEFRGFEEKLANMESMIDTMRDQLGETSRAHKEQIKGNAQSLESKIAALETSSKGIIADLKQLKAHANESAASLAQLMQKCTELGKASARQDQDIDNLQAALRSIVEALGVGKESPKTATSENSYRVKSGDTLEKIAHLHGTTVRVLKELNNIPDGKDKIVVGKQLLMPEKKK
jgi:LysM repeat protein